jgi:hypothetical protein
MHGTPMEGEGAIVDAQIETNNNMQQTRTRCIKLITGIFLFGFVVFIAVDAFSAQRVGKAMIAVLGWVETNPALGVFVYVALYFFMTSE